MTRCAVALVLSFVTNAALACEAELRTWFDMMKPAAALIVGRATGSPERMKAMMDLKMKHDPQETRDAYASALLGRGAVVTYNLLCKEPLERQQGVIAHELGHFMGYEIFQGHKARVDAGTSSYTEEESYADQWGAKVLRELKIDSTKYLALLDAACQRGSQYFCRAAMNWRAGLTY
jgi:hypothetical protein